jgi:ABC-type sulfate transport system substrate-binding protein
VLKKGGNEAQARELVGKIFKNVPCWTGGRGATTTFTQREIGDVLVTFENEVNLVRAEFGDKFDVVYPPPRSWPNRRWPWSTRWWTAATCASRPPAT